MSAAVLDHHLASCINCARWLEQATRLTRQARLSSVVVPDLSGLVTAGAVLPARRVLRRRVLVRAGLVLAGLVEVVVGFTTVDGAHVGHEAAAWNLALGVALVATAWRPRRAAGLVPLLMTFVIVLLALSIGDIADGAASAVRETAHLGAVAGLLLVLALDRSERARPRDGSAVTPTDQPGDGGDGRLRGVA